MGKSGVSAGDVVLMWDPVSTTVDGRPTEIKHYQVYASDVPFSREDVRDGLLAPMAIVDGSIFEFTPASQNRYYSVLAVDTRGNVSPY